uniref:Chromo domain-containing protein n=1 Tax=Ananas comosus var. bracteatus TaxID=296719 RepID=A0A6V7PR84_ANACO|nr:unnamed protein product [Ananas comosus var. bracteatus]
MTKEIRDNLLKAQNRMKRAKEPQTLVLLLRALRDPRKDRANGLPVTPARGSKVHPVFLVSLLKRSPPEGRTISATVPLTGDDSQLLAEPAEILDQRMVQRDSMVVTQVLVRWSNLPPNQTTWEDYWFLKS